MASLRRPLLFGGLVAAAGLAAAVAGGGQADEKERVLRLFVGEFVDLRPGTGKFPREYRMGSAEAGAPAAERPAHPVTLRRPFAMAKYEVTQELYEALTGRNPSRWRGRRNSVENVSWDEAVAFCRQATAELRRRKLLAENEVIRLPSEAEWEYACRAGTDTRYSFGDDPADLGEYGWYSGNAKGNDPPVGKKKPNPWGLYDLHGYVWEWCADAWHPNYGGAPDDGSAWEAKPGAGRVVRGGSWADPADAARSAFRRRHKADYRSDAVGFRCVRAEEGGRP